MRSRTPRIAAKPTLGPARTIIAVGGIAVLSNAGLVLFGEESPGVGSQVLALFAPPEWLVGSVWVVLFALLGLVRWRMLRLGSEAGRECARWTIVFVVICALYPAYTLGLRSLFAGFMGNIGTAIFAVALGLRVRRIDNPSARVFALVVAWLCYATLAITAQLGWLPGWANGL
jgi:tryptophan-rich sensory protein